MHPAPMQKHRREQRPSHRDRTGNLGTRPRTLLQVYATAEWVAHQDGHDLHDRLVQVFVVPDLVRSSRVRERELVTRCCWTRKTSHVDRDECVGDVRNDLRSVQVTKRKNHGRASRSKERLGRMSCGARSAVAGNCSSGRSQSRHNCGETATTRSATNRRNSPSARILMKSVWL